LSPALNPTIGGWITDNYSWHWIFFINAPIGALSLFLTHDLVHYPLWLKNINRSCIRADYIGIALIVSTLGFFSTSSKSSKRTGSPPIRSRFSLSYPPSP
jgi:MFS transporter, DHA2 family, multidrug resistance protein